MGGPAVRQGDEWTGSLLGSDTTAGSWGAVAIYMGNLSLSCHGSSSRIQLCALAPTVWAASRRDKSSWHTSTDCLMKLSCDRQEHQPAACVAGSVLSVH